MTKTPLNAQKHGKTLSIDNINPDMIKEPGKQPDKPTTIPCSNKETRQRQRSEIPCKCIYGIMFWLMVLMVVAYGWFSWVLLFGGWSGFWGLGLIVAAGGGAS